MLTGGVIFTRDSEVEDSTSLAICEGVTVLLPNTGHDILRAQALKSQGLRLTE
jgi:hypothetical protein